MNRRRLRRSALLPGLRPRNPWNSRVRRHWLAYARCAVTPPQMVLAPSRIWSLEPARPAGHRWCRHGRLVCTRAPAGSVQCAARARGRPMERRALRARQTGRPHRSHRMFVGSGKVLDDDLVRIDDSFSTTPSPPVLPHLTISPRCSGRIRGTPRRNEAIGTSRRGRGLPRRDGLALKAIPAGASGRR